jgi:hypothetical protein
VQKVVIENEIRKLNMVCCRAMVVLTDL